MSWRRFQVLLRCLSQNSATVTRMQGEKQFGKKDKESLVVGAKAADHAFDSLFKDVGAKKRKRQVGSDPAPA